MIRRLILCFILVSSLLSAGKAQFAESPKQELHHFFGFGIFAHTRGLGFEVQSAKLTGKTDFFFILAMSNYKQFSEQKIESLYKEQGGKKYVFDKKNYAYILAPMLGISKQFFGQSNFNKIGLRGTLTAGPILAFLKPYYIEVAVPIPGTSTANVQVHPYDGTLYGYGDIVGEADFFLGLDEMKLVPGIRANARGTLDFSAAPEYIRALEFGVYLDYFFKELQVYDLRGNPKLYLGASVSLLIGNAW